MKKDFTQWHSEKTKVHQSESCVFFHEREIWWCRIGLNIGYEQDGKGDNFARPVIIFKKFNNEVCWIIPLSTIYANRDNIRGDTFVSPRGRSRLEFKHSKYK